MALATLKQLKKSIDIPTDKIDPIKDALLEDMIDRVSARIESYCGRTFASTTYTEYINGDDTIYLYPQHYPIISITSIYDDYEYDFEATDLIDSGDYRIMGDAETIMLIPGSTATSFSEGVDNIKLTYVAGYATLPYDLNMACIEETLIVWKRRMNPGLTSIALENGSIQRFETDFLPSTISILNYHRRMTIV